MRNSDPPVRLLRVITRLNVGGPAIHVSLLTAGLSTNGFHSILVTGAASQDEGDMSGLAARLGVRPVVIPDLQRAVSIPRDIHALGQLLAIMRKERPHIVHTHTAKAGFLGRLAAILARVPVILHTYHGHVFRGYFNPARTRIYMALERIVTRRSDAVIAVSERIGADLAALGIARREQIHVVPLGLDLDPYENLGPLRGQLRRQLKIPLETPIIGSVGRLVPIKRHDLFLKAARRVADVVPSAQFVIAGDGELRGRMERLASELGLEGQTKFLGWRDDLPSIYADMDLLVVSSDSEGTPVSMIEALAAGVPVVATNVGGVADVLQEGRFGALIPPGDELALAEAIMAALSSRPPSFREEAQLWVRSRYHRERLISTLAGLYRDLLAKKGIPDNISLRV